MGKTSLIYRNIFIYRLGMNILYAGKYKNRFAPVTSRIGVLPPGSHVLELCFGDTYIANYCRKKGYRWRGLDINPGFVDVARRIGFDAETTDLTMLTELPKATVCVMMGSLYHFHQHAQAILANMLQAAPEVIISEPIINISALPGLLGKLARKSANAGQGHQAFRYDRQSLLLLLETERRKLGFHIASVQDHNRDLIIRLTRNEKQ